MIKYFIAFLIALMTSYILTPYAIKIAHKIGAIDVPKDNRRVHKTPIPRLGGLAIFSAFVITSLVMIPVDRQLAGILVGASIYKKPSRQSEKL